MKLDLKDVTGAYGTSVPFEYEADLHDWEMNGEYPFQTPIKISGAVYNRLGVLELHADIAAVYKTRCARCLKPIEVPVGAVCDMTLSYDRENDERDDIYLLEGDYVDLDDVVLPALLLEINMTYLCKEDCKGLCQKCGADLNEGECGCSKVEIDDRLAILKTLLEKKE